jgi:hypothetical protein
MFLSELQVFPFGAPDYLVDNFTMALHLMEKRSGKAVC